MRYFDQTGKPMTHAEWIMAFTDTEARRVARDLIGDAEVSTVWLGLDHGFGTEPLIFETMIFGGDKDGTQIRYSTKDEALERHKELVAELRGEDH